MQYTRAGVKYDV